MPTSKNHSKIMFRLGNGEVIEALVDRPHRILRSQVRDAMKRFMKNGTPKKFAFKDMMSGRTWRVELANVETWKVKSNG